MNELINYLRTFGKLELILVSDKMFQVKISEGFDNHMKNISSCVNAIEKYYAHKNPEVVKYMVKENLFLLYLKF
jgi:hypothetical protein